LHFVLEEVPAFLNTPKGLEDFSEAFKKKMQPKKK